MSRGYAAEIRWEVLLDSGWEEISGAEAQQLSAVYSRLRAGSTDRTCNFTSRRGGAVFNYEVNFATMIQKNLDNGTERQVRIAAGSMAAGARGAAPPVRMPMAAGPQCCISGCNRAPWNGQRGQPCCRTCSQSQGANHGPECNRTWQSDQAVQLAALAPKTPQTGTALFHASPQTNRSSIQRNGLKATNGRIGCGVYAVFTEGQARQIGDQKCGGPGNYDVWRFYVDQNSHKLNVQEHPPWCGLDQFKEVLVPESLTGPDRVQLV